MSKRGRHKRLFPKKMASDFINVTQRPRYLVTEGSSSEGTDIRCPHCLYNLAEFVKPNVRVYQCPNCKQTLIGGIQSYDHWFDYHARVRNVIGPKHNKTVVEDNTFTQSVPKTVGRIMDSYVNDDGTVIPAERTPKQEVTRKLNEEKPTSIEKIIRTWASKDGRGHGIEEFHCLNVVDRPTKKVKLFFCGNKFFFLKDEKGEIMVSTMFGSHAIAMKFWEEGIKWRKPP